MPWPPIRARARLWRQCCLTSTWRRGSTRHSVQWQLAGCEADMMRWSFGLFLYGFSSVVQWKARSYCSRPFVEKKSIGPLIVKDGSLSPLAANVNRFARLMASNLSSGTRSEPTFQGSAWGASTASPGLASASSRAAPWSMSAATVRSTRLRTRFHEHNSRQWMKNGNLHVYHVARHLTIWNAASARRWGQWKTLKRWWSHCRRGRLCASHAKRKSSRTASGSAPDGSRAEAAEPFFHAMMQPQILMVGSTAAWTALLGTRGRRMSRLARTRAASASLRRSKSRASPESATARHAAAKVAEADHAEEGVGANRPC